MSCFAIVGLGVVTVPHLLAVLIAAVDLVRTVREIQ